MSDRARIQPALGREALTAVRIVGEAVTLLQSVQDQITAEALAKADASPVTVADFAVQALVSARLAREAPGDRLVAEEDASALRTGDGRLRELVLELVRRAIPDASESDVLDWIDAGNNEPNSRFWTLDPIDGTKGLIHGRQYAIALALIADGRVDVGVIGCPRLSVGAADDRTSVEASAGGLAVAVRGDGAWWRSSGADRDVSLQVSAQSDPARARVLRSYEERHGDMVRCGHILQEFGSQELPALMDSQAKHVVLAAGVADVVMRVPPDRNFFDAIWDYAAGSLLIEEAGGRVTDLAGRPLDFTAGRRFFHNDGILASNGALHEAALAAIGAAG
jgi:3'(2'), 5'-bisphosphate nucleotidase